MQETVQCVFVAVKLLKWNYCNHGRGNVSVMIAGLMELSLRAASPMLGPVAVRGCPTECPTQAGGESSAGFPFWAAAAGTNPLGGRWEGDSWASRREGEREGGKHPPASPDVPSHLGG